MKTLIPISSRGVITIPAKLRKRVGMQPNENVIAETTPEGILLRPTVTLPVEMYTEEQIQEFDQLEDDLAKRMASTDLTE